MVSGRFSIINESGLNVRAAGVLVRSIHPFLSKILLKIEAKEYNAKSILGLMSAGIKCGDEVMFVCEGEDENEALKAIGEAISSGLGEN